MAQSTATGLGVDTPNLPAWGSHAFHTCLWDLPLREPSALATSMLCNLSSFQDGYESQFPQQEFRVLQWLLTNCSCEEGEWGSSNMQRHLWFRLTTVFIWIFICVCVCAYVCSLPQVWYTHVCTCVEAKAQPSGVVFQELCVFETGSPPETWCSQIRLRWLASSS